MKTISELQQEIRNMQADMNKRLSEINDELVNYKDAGMSGSVYKQICGIAQNMPIIKHPIINQGIAVKNNYFAILILIATCENSINDDQLLFLQRMAMADSQRTTIDQYMSGIGNLNPQNVIYNINDSVKYLKNQLVLDMLIIASLEKRKQG